MSEAPTAEEVGTPPAEDEESDTESTDAEETESEGSDEEASEDEASEEESETALEDMTKAELLAVAEEKGIEVKKSWSNVKIIAALTDTTAPVDELLPIINVGHWVRFGSHKAVPQHLVGRDGVVLRAPVKRAQGDDKLSPTPYQYQDGSEEFLVEARDTRETLTLTRDAFAKFATDEVFLAAA